MRIIDAITYDLTGSRTTGLDELVIALRGNVSAAARALGVPRTTLRRWLAGGQPAPGRRRAITAAARGALTATRRPGYYTDAYEGTRTLVIRGVIHASRDVRTRDIHVGRYIPKPIMKTILTYWAHGRDQRAETTLENAIVKYYADLDVDNVERTWFE